MHDVVRMPHMKLKELFSLTAEQMAMPPGIVEKDFWVVCTLDYLFARSPWRTQLAFKGGTSLSKAYGLIKRFSEDIDLILDWRLLGYGLREPWESVRLKRWPRKFMSAKGGSVLPAINFLLSAVKLPQNMEEDS